MKKNFSVITANTVEEILKSNHDDVYEVIKKTYIDHFEKNVVNPPSCFLWYPDKKFSRIIALPSLIKSNKKKVAGIKWVSSIPENIDRGLNRASAVAIINDYETGYPLACIEASLISATRTAYSAVLTIDQIKPNRKVQTLGVVGTGRIAFNTIKCMSKQNWLAKNLFLYDKISQNAEKFKSKLLEEHLTLGANILVANDLNKLLENCDLIIFATTSKEPYVNDYNLLKKNAILLNISLRDLSAEIIEKSVNIVDDLNHVMNADTSPHLAKKKYGHTKFITTTIGSMLINGIDDVNKPVIISPMGLGALDLALSNFVYKQAIDKQENILITDFF